MAVTGLQDQKAVASTTQAQSTVEVLHQGLEPEIPQGTTGQVTDGKEDTKMDSGAAGEVKDVTQAESLPKPLRYPSPLLVRALRATVKHKRKKKSGYKKGKRAMAEPQKLPFYDVEYYLEPSAIAYLRKEFGGDIDPYVLAGNNVIERLHELLADEKETTVVVPCRTSASYMLDLVDNSIRLPRLLPTGAVKMTGHAPPWFKPSSWVAVLIKDRESAAKFKSDIEGFTRRFGDVSRNPWTKVVPEGLEPEEAKKLGKKKEELEKLYMAIVNSDAETGTFSSKSLPWDEEDDNADIYVPRSEDVAASLEAKKNPKKEEEHMMGDKHKIGIQGKHRQMVLQLLTQYKELLEPITPAGVTAMEHHIELTKVDPPIRIQNYKLNDNDKLWLIEEAEKLCKQGLLQRSESDWRAIATAAPKKNAQGEYKDRRFCVNYRALNKRTIKDNYPMPNLAECLRMRGAKFFTKLDLKSGFWQVPVAPKDRHLTAFAVGDKVYEWVVMPMGLKNSPMTFQRLIDQVLRGIKGEYAFGYIDDIVVFSETLDEHMKHLEEVLKRLKQFRFRLNVEKCEYVSTSVKYLGHVVSNGTIGLDPDKITAVRDIPYPTAEKLEDRIKQVQSFLGLTGFYRRFIRGYSGIAHSLTELTKQGVKWKFEDTEKRAWDLLKTKIIEAPILMQPDMKREFILECDASKYGLGAVLQQIGPDGKLHPISFISRKLTPTERRYAVREKEALAILWSITKLREFLSSAKFRVRTDHKSLTWMLDMVDPKSRLGRWAQELATYDFDICYKKGSENKLADAMSRIGGDETKKALVGQVSVVGAVKVPGSFFRVYGVHTRAQAKLKKAHEAKVRTETKKRLETKAKGRQVEAARKKAEAKEGKEPATGEPERKREQKGEPDGEVKSEAKGATEAKVGAEAEAKAEAEAEAKAEAEEDARREEKAALHARSVLRGQEIKMSGEELKEREEKVVAEEEEDSKQDRKFHSHGVRDGSLDTEKDTIQVDDEYRMEDTWTQEYRIDPQWKHLYLHLKGEAKLDDLDEKQRNRVLRRLGYFVVEEDKLLFKHRQKPTDQEVMLVVVPLKSRFKIMNLYHDNQLAGHRGVKPMTAMIMRTYYWPGLRRDIRKYVATCRGCRLAKAPWRPKMGLRGDFGIELGKLEHLHVDHVGPLSRTRNGNSFILTMIDRCTGWFDAVAVHDKTMEVAATEIFRRWICQRGSPSILTADNAFRAEDIKELGRRCGFRSNITASYHPESNGKIERVHRDLKAYFKIWTEGGEDWEELLPGFIFAHNNTPKDGERYSPAFLMFGREMRMPAEVLTDGIRLQDQETQIDEMLNNMKIALKLAYAVRKRRAEKDKERLEGKLQPTVFEVGDECYVYRPKGPKGVCGKLWMGWQGPYVVLAKRTSGFTYEVQRPGGKGKKSICHVTNMISMEELDREPAKPIEWLEQEQEEGLADESEGEEEMQEAEEEIKGVRGGKKRVRKETKKSGEPKILPPIMKDGKKFVGGVKKADIKVDDFIIVQEGDTRYLMRVMAKAQNLISAQYWRGRGDKFYAVWFDPNTGLEDWTNKKQLTNSQYMPMISDTIKVEDILLTFEKLGKNNTIPTAATNRWEEITGGKDITLCN